MTRSLAAGFQTALINNHVDLFYAVEMVFDSGTIRLWTGIGNRTIGGQVYTGTGSLLNIEGLDEASDMGAKSATITLSGVDSSLVSLALQEPYQGRACRIYLGITTTTDVATCFSGAMDVMTIQDSGETSTIAITVESRMARLDRPIVFRYTSESQKDRYAGDTFFDWVAKLADKSISWGRNTKGD